MSGRFKFVLRLTLTDRAEPFTPSLGMTFAANNSSDLFPPIIAHKSTNFI